VSNVTDTQFEQYKNLGGTMTKDELTTAVREARNQVTWKVGEYNFTELSGYDGNRYYFVKMDGVQKGHRMIFAKS
jgi:hypothetical protein